LRASDEDLEGALEDYDRAIRIEPWLPAALSGKGAVLMRLGRLDEAIAVNEKVLSYKTRDLISSRNLAILYRQKGDVGMAIHWAKKARGVAPNGEKPALDTFIAELESGAPAPDPSGYP